MAKILLVEDDKSLREIYGVRLMAEGYEIVSAGDGEEALAMAIKERPDLIVSDVMMPKISGFDMLDILRSTTETKNVKVIMMTALSSEDQRARGEALGADRYLVKSQVGIEDVVRTVHDVLGDGVPNAAPAPVYTTAEAPVQPIAAPVEAAPVAAAAPVAIEFPDTPVLSELPTPTAPLPVLEAVPVALPTPSPVPTFTPAPAAFDVPVSPVAPAEPIAPVTPVAPIAPIAPVATPAPFPAPAPVAAPAAMPQPTAPFSAPATLGERVIAPLSDFTSQPGPGVLDLSSQMDQALNSPSVPPTPPTV
ncbi:MAG: hypothetical protein JWN28_749 [Candidatus Saccharibacteria bacterium]|nr:hypothetical protein [Candidatus Saccharibacteria bacterium]